MNLQEELKKQAAALKEVLGDDSPIKGTDMPSKIAETSSINFKEGYLGVAIFTDRRSENIIDYGYDWYARKHIVTE